MTIVEVLAAMLIMLIGVLGTLTMIDGSASSTSRTIAREQGTNLARDLVERTRQAAFTDTTMSHAPVALRASLPVSDAATALSGPSSSTFVVTRRNTDYAVTIFACSIDDPTDGAGVGDATFCAGPSGTNHPGSPTPGLAASVNVLGVAVSLGGSLLNTVCAAVGTNPAILASLTAVVSTVAPISICPSAVTGAPPSVQYDARPDDLRRVSVDVSWTRGGRTGAVRQTTLLTNPLQS